MAVAVGLGIGVFVWVGTGVALLLCAGVDLGFFVLAGFFVGLAKAALASTWESDFACAGKASRQVKIRTKNIR